MKFSIKSLLFPLLVLLVGCGYSLQATDATDIINVERPTDYHQPSQTAQYISTTANSFAFDLANFLAVQKGSENLVFSPYSVWMPLAALANAGNYFIGSNVQEINDAAHRAIYNLTQNDAIHIANAIFVDNLFELQQGFIDAFAQYFGAIAYSADFGLPDTVDEINRWAYNNTNGRIPEILQDLDPDAMSVILNAIYFNNSWQIPFSPNRNQTRTFYGANSNQENITFMQREGTIPYFEDDHVQAVRLYYENGFGMYIILPLQQTATEFLQNFTMGYFTEISNSASYTPNVLITMPKFSIENNLPLLDILKAMGLDVELPNLVVYSPYPIEISRVLQNAMIEVDEEGTVAAAVTAIEVVQESLPFFTYFTADRPFVFVLYGEHQDNPQQILFMGMLNEVK
ncbi:MAG: hypothetical protein FWG63_01280 [Defluviitaleaceae bacterium]|nr:hypothetical protein [Defluviitaleaceae bacterium]